MRRTHSPVVVNDVSHDLSHLNCFGVLLPNSSGPTYDDLRIEVVISCHVYTVRSPHQHIVEVKDHRGNNRLFDRTRYELSLQLPKLIRDVVLNNGTVYQIRDRNQVSNLALFQLQKGDFYRVLHFFEPHTDKTQFDLQLNVISAYISDKPNLKGNALKFYARKCYFENSRIPK